MGRTKIKIEKINDIKTRQVFSLADYIQQKKERAHQEGNRDRNTL